MAMQVTSSSATSSREEISNRRIVDVRGRIDSERRQDRRLYAGDRARRAADRRERFGIQRSDPFALRFDRTAEHRPHLVARCDRTLMIAAAAAVEAGRRIGVVATE